MIPYSRQDITKEDITAVVKVLKSNLITQGSSVPKFESAIAKKVNVNYATAVNSATSALHIACLALGVGSGDYVWTSANSFVASANCALYCGARIDLVDINPVDWNMSIFDLSKKLKIAQKNKKLPKVIVSVHFTGQPVEQEKLYKLSKKYGFKIIEDASHSLGAYRKKEPVGNCKWSDITVFSFHPVKIITTGEGGIAVTKSKLLDKKLKSLRTHGIVRESNELLNKSDGPWYFEQQSLGFNYRMTDIHAALGISQLKRLDKIIKKRNSIANIYNKKLLDLDIQKVLVDTNNISSYHLYPIVIKQDKGNSRHLRVFNYLQENGINVGLHYIPIYRHPYYKRFKFNLKEFPNTEKYYKSAISLPIFYKLTNNQINKICKLLKEAMTIF